MQGIARIASKSETILYQESDNISLEVSLRQLAEQTDHRRDVHRILRQKAGRYGH